MEMNVIAVKEMIKLAKEMKNLEVPCLFIPVVVSSLLNEMLLL